MTNIAELVGDGNRKKIVDNFAPKLTNSCCKLEHVDQKEIE